jgi:hypothetical protein
MILISARAVGGEPPLEEMLPLEAVKPRLPAFRLPMKSDGQDGELSS